MTDYTVTLTDTQIKSLSYVGADPKDWMENAIYNRARKATDEIIALLVKHCNENSIAIEVGTDAQVAQAFELGVAKTAEQRNAEAEAAKE
tara:strand:+ start:2271 stop:2540 length:270 start_codon:yes stop_codon:yes gene_type:complete